VENNENVFRHQIDAIVEEFTRELKELNENLNKLTPKEYSDKLKRLKELRDKI
jgi:hypothetical protein